jgi:hypothetical protein
MNPIENEISGLPENPSPSIQISGMADFRFDLLRIC